MLRHLSPLLFPAFGLSLLLLRHHPLVASHWLVWLQVPRLAGFGVALWWALGERAGRVGGGRGAAPVEGPSSAGTYTGLDPAGRVGVKDRKAPSVTPPGPSGMPAGYHLPPSHAIAASLLLADGLAAAGGLWAHWGDVRLLSAVAWLVVAAIGWRAR